MTSAEFKELWNKYNASDSISERKQINEQLMVAVFEVAEVLWRIHDDMKNVYNVCDITLRNQIHVPHKGQKCEIVEVGENGNIHYWAPIGAYNFDLSIDWFDNLETKKIEYEKTLLEELFNDMEMYYINLKRNLNLFECGINSIKERLQEIEASPRV